jgi:ketosteroid isomerase-like protein
VSKPPAGPAGRVVTEVVDRFNAAWNAHDLAGALALCTVDCAFESTSPAPDGTRSVGRQAIADAWRPIFDDPASTMTVEDAFLAGERVVQRWRYDWSGGHVRGIDVITVRDGLLSEKLSYVKG